MKHGFIKVAAATPKITVANPIKNAQQILTCVKEAKKKEAKIVVFPEMCLTGYTCEDLFYQELLLEEAKKQLSLIAKETKGYDALLFIGVPIEREHKLYNAAAVLHRGEVLAFIPKTYLPNYGEFYEARHFTKGNENPCSFMWEDKEVPFGTHILFENRDINGLIVGCEICEDIWSLNPPNTYHALAGANVLVNLSASNETVGKDTYRKSLVTSTSARVLSGYIYCSSGEGESTQDLVFGGHNIIAENGTLLAEADRFDNEITYADLDIFRLKRERRFRNTIEPLEESNYIYIPFDLDVVETKLERKIDKAPFVPADTTTKNHRCEEILKMQAHGLKKRFEHTGCQKAIIGISGGLDSTLALLVTITAFDLLNIDRSNIIAVTMPCFGTTDRTYTNACVLTKTLGATLEEIDIKEAVLTHFRDIKHDQKKHDVTYENSQARERTQILMDIANRENGLVIGTGDMSELALGWATYNGDHMSMYGVNVGVPKTLVKHLVSYFATTCKQEELKTVLLDVLDTPVSPELLPPVDGEIAQKTEDLVGPYELHDFFLYYMLRFGMEPEKIYRLAQIAFSGQYENEVIRKWLKTFYRRFFTQQFKRTCLPDGPKIGSVAVSPRGDLRMPSDASAQIWLDQIEQL